MSKTILHMHPTSWYVSLPSLHDNEVNLPNNTFYDGHKRKETIFVLVFRIWIQSFQNSSPEKFAQRKISLPQRRRVRVIARTCETQKSIFLSCYRRGCLRSCTLRLLEQEVTRTLLFYSLIFVQLICYHSPETFPVFLLSIYLTTFFARLSRFQSYNMSFRSMSSPLSIARLLYYSSYHFVLFLVYTACA